MKREHAWSIAFVLIAAIAGCGTKPYSAQDPIDPKEPAKTKDHYRLPAGAKAGLITASFTVTLPDERDAYVADPQYRNPYGRSATEEGLAYAAYSPIGCLPALVFYPFCVAGMVVVMPALGVAIDAANSNPEPPASDGKSEKKESSGTSERGAVVGVVDEWAAEQEATAEALGPYAERLAALPPVPERVHRYLSERGIAGFSIIASHAQPPPPDQAQSTEKVDYRFELTMPNVVALPSIRAGGYWFHVIAAGRLVRTNDNAVLDEFVTRTYTKAHLATAWIDENGDLVVTELDKALNSVSKKIVAEWIAPAIHESH